MGIALGMIEDLSLDAFDTLFIDAQAGAVMESAGEDLDPVGRDSYRARLVRERLQ